MQNNRNFDIIRDIEIVNSGGFFCQACIIGKPLDDISPDPRYCQDCYEVLQDEKQIAKESKDKRDYWSKDGDFFIHYGKKYGVSKTGSTICLGEVEERPQNTPQNTGMPLLQGEESVTRPSEMVSIGCTDDVTLKIREMAQPGVGCRKIAKKLQEQGINISYRTVSRRLQGVLL